MGVDVDLRWKADRPVSGKGRRLLLIYGRTPYTPGRYLEDAMRRSGIDVTRFSDAPEEATPGDFDACMWIESPSRPTPRFETAAELPRPRIAWVYHGEHRLAKNLDTVRAFDPDVVLLAHSLHLASEFGRSVGFFPFAWDPTVFPDGQAWQDRQLDVAFVGSGLGRISKGQYRRRSEHLRVVRRTVGKRRRKITSDVYLDDLSAIYRDAKIVLDDSADPHRSINMRVWEAMGSGALLVAERIAGQELLFDEGADHLGFDDNQELAVALRWALANPVEAASIARAGQDRVSRSHRYSHRVERLLEWVDDLQ